MALHGKKVTYSSHSSRAARAAHAKGDREFRTYDTSAIMPKKSPAPFICLGIVAVVVIAAVCFFAFRGCAGSQVELLAPGQSAEVTITEGETASSIGDALVAARLICSSREFTDEVTRLEASSALIPGTYTFQGGSTPEELVRAIMAGPAQVGDTLAVPEDITRAELSELVASATGGRITAEAFLAASENASAYAADYAFLESAGENSLEGFLFPKTYAVTEDMDAEAVVRMMLDQFGTETASIFGDFANSYPASQGLTLYQAVNLASIVAKESTGDQEVRDHVAGVFYNRLASDRPYLESDATTAYEVGREPTAEEVHAETPYSTYANAGLPPTPICSPGLESLTAVCEPTQTEDMFFYFYPDADGNMQAAFSKTYEEHQQAIADNSNAGGADGSGDAAAGEGAAA